MRPNVSQSWPASQSGAWSLIDEIRPAAEPQISQMMASERHSNAGPALLRSIRWRSASSACSAGSGRSASGATARCRAAWPAASSTGSSTRPRSCGSKICCAAASPCPKRPRAIDAMKAIRATNDTRKVASSRPTVPSIRRLPGEPDRHGGDRTQRKGRVRRRGKASASWSGFRVARRWRLDPRRRRWIWRRRLLCRTAALQITRSPGQPQCSAERRERQAAPCAAR